MKYHGTFAELRTMREAWTNLEAAAGTLAVIPGWEKKAVEMQAEADILGASEFAVDVRCVVCRHWYPSEVLVGDPRHSEPNAVLCGPCDQLIEEGIRHKHLGAHKVGKGPGMLCTCPDRTVHLRQEKDHVHVPGSLHTNWMTHPGTKKHQHSPSGKIEWTKDTEVWQLVCSVCHETNGRHEGACDAVAIPRLVPVPAEVVLWHQGKHDPQAERVDGCVLCEIWRHPTEEKVRGD